MSPTRTTTSLIQAATRENQEVTLRVTVAGIPLAPSFETVDPTSDGAYTTGVPGCMGYTLHKDIETKLNTCDLKVDFVPDWLIDGAAVTVDVGYDTFTIRRFTGTVQNLQHAIGVQTISCFGTAWKLFRQLDADLADVSGLTVDQAIVQRLTSVGLTDVAIAVHDFVLGSNTPAELAAGQTLDQVGRLLDINDGVLYELASGQIVGVGAMYFLPAPTSYAFFTTNRFNPGAYLLNVRIIDASDREDPNYFRDHVTATGASIPDGDPEDPDTTFTPLEASPASLVGADIRQPPSPAGRFSSQEFSNDLIDTQAEIDLYARRKLTKFARIPRYLEVEIVGNPTIELGMTLGLAAPELNVGGNWFIAAINEQCSVGQGLTTTCELTGGSRFGGTIQQNPTAAFTYTAIQQVLNDRLVTIVTADASTSHDADGSIVSYAWSGAGTGSGVRFVFIIDQDADPSPDLTLTVTDSTGLTGTRTQSINTDQNNNATFIPQPSVWVSGGPGGADATPDGGLTFNTFTGAGADATAVDAKPTDALVTGVAVHGYADGSLWRTTDFDLTGSQAFAPTGDAITVVWWDKIVATRCWAGTLNGALLVSNDNGATFTVYEAATGYPIWWIATPIPGGIWRGGGRGDQPNTLIRYDAVVGGHAFQSVPIGGQLDLTGATSALTCRAAAGRIAGELMIGFGGELTAAGTNVFHTNTIFVGAGWFKATGLDGKAEVRAIAPDFGPGVFHVMFDGEQSVWQTINNIAFTESAGVFPAGFSAVQALWEGEFLGGLDGIHLVALINSGGDGAVYKSQDGLETAVPFYPIAGISTIPAGSQALAIAIGAPGNGVVAGGLLSRSGFQRQIDEFNGSSNWNTVRATDADAGLAYLMRFQSGAYLALRENRGMMYSGPTDAAFAETLGWSAGYTVRGFDIGAGGRIWAVRANTSAGVQATSPTLIEDSTNEGATFALQHTDPGWTGNSTPLPASMFCAIVADKWNPNNVFIACVGITAGAPKRIYTIDGGATWLAPTTGPDVPLDFSGDKMIFANSGRIVLVGGGAAAVSRHTDDFGVTWVAAATALAIASSTHFAPYRTNHNNRGVLAFNPTGGVVDEIWLTRDNHDSYTPLAVPSFGLPIGGMEYDAPNDRLYVQIGTTAVAQIDGVFDGTPTVTDITFNLTDSGVGTESGVALPR